MELGDLLAIVRKRWWVIAALTVLGSGGGYLFSALSPVEYQATTEVFVSYTAEAGSASDLNAGNAFASSRVKSYTQAVTTEAVLGPVISELGLNTTVPALAEDVSATVPTNTVIMQITVTSGTAQQAADIANAIAAEMPVVIDQIEKPDTSGSAPVKISTLQPALVPAAPSSPNLTLNLALGLLVGIASGLGLALLLNFLDNRVRSSRDIQHITDTPLVGGIPNTPDIAGHALAVVSSPASPTAEAFRSLRTNVQFLLADRTNSLLVTSAMAAEGKTTTGANLALAIAQAGFRVALVDADLRKPRLASIFGLDGSVGLTDVLIGRLQVEEALQMWTGGGTLAILPAGSIPPNASELLGSASMRNVVSDLQKHYDVVLVDTAPILPVTDAAVLSRLVGGVLVVTAAGQTTREQLADAIGALEAVDASIAGVILTKIPTKGANAGGYSRYGYYGAYSRSASPSSTHSHAPAPSHQVGRRRASRHSGTEAPSRATREPAAAVLDPVFAGPRTTQVVTTPVRATTRVSALPQPPQDASRPLPATLAAALGQQTPPSASGGASGKPGWAPVRDA